MSKKLMLGVFLGFALIITSSALAKAQTKPESVRSKEPVKIGVNLDLTGVMSEVATHVRRGYEIYLEDIGYEVAGRKIEVIEYDNRSDPKVSLEVAQKLIKKDKVHMMGGWINSAGAIAVKNYLIEQKVPMVIFGFAGSENLTLPRNKYVFRPNYADGQYERALAHYAYDKLGYRKMTVFGPDFVGGTGKLASFTHGFEEKGGKIVQTILHPLGTYDISPYLAKLSMEAQAVFAFEPGDIAVVRFLTQYFESGLKEKVGLCVYETMAQDYLPVKVFGEQMIDTYSCHHYTPSFAGPENDHFKKLYAAKYPRDIANCYNEAGYTGFKFIAAALKSINGQVEDQESFLKAMSAAKIQSPCSVVSLDENNNAVRDFLITKIEKVGNRVENVVKYVARSVKQPPVGFTILRK